MNLASVYEKLPITPALSLKGRGENSKSHLNVTHLERVWDRSFAVHLKGAYQLALASAALMQKNKWGRIIMVSDWTAASGRPRYQGYLPYYTAKGGVLALTQSLALELSPDILVNAVAPGPIIPFSGISRKEAVEVVKNTPLRRWGGAEEIAKAVCFFADTEFVTGECLRVDGGRHLY